MNRTPSAALPPYSRIRIHTTILHLRRSRDDTNNLRSKRLNQMHREDYCAYRNAMLLLLGDGKRRWTSGPTIIGVRLGVGDGVGADDGPTA
eukprot:scaffold2927_cov268-Chaetoceros_neogracile.AAC.10